MNDPAVQIMLPGVVVPMLPGHGVVADDPIAAEPALRVGQS